MDSESQFIRLTMVKSLPIDRYRRLTPEIRKEGANIDVDHSFLGYNHIYFKVLKLNILTKHLILNNVQAELIIEVFWIISYPDEEPESEDWDPGMYITNTFGHVKTAVNNRFVTRSDGIKVQVQRKSFKGTFVQNIIWNKFPFDDQKLEFYFLANNYRDYGKIIVIPNPHPNWDFVFVAFEDKEYILGDLEYVLSMEEGKRSQPDVGVNLHVIRNPTIYIPYFFYELCVGVTIMYSSGFQDTYCDYRYVYLCMVFILFVLLDCRSARYMPATCISHSFDNFHTFILLYYFVVFCYCSVVIVYYNDRPVEMREDDFFKRNPETSDYGTLTYISYIIFFNFLFYFVIYVGSSIRTRLNIAAEVQATTSHDSHRRSSYKKRTIVDDFNNFNNYAAPKGSVEESFICDDGMVVRSAGGDVCYFYAKDHHDDDDKRKDDDDDSSEGYSSDDSDNDDDGYGDVYNVGNTAADDEDEYVKNFATIEEYFQRNTCIKLEEEEKKEDDGVWIEVENSVKQ